MTNHSNHYPLSKRRQTVLLFIFVGLLCCYFADLEITTRTPWHELNSMILGLVHLDWLPFDTLAQALLHTLAFAVAAVGIAAPIGFILCLSYHSRSVRVACAIIRSIHELFWGLLFIQLMGLHPLAGILAISIPFSGIFAKVFAEILEENQPKDRDSFEHVDKLSRFFYQQWPRVKNHFLQYGLYRLECALRSSTVLGFIGLPTLGFHLESGFMQGYYGQVAALLIITYTLIASIRFWMRTKLFLPYFIISLFYLWSAQSINWSLLPTLLHDLIPTPLRTENGITLYQWLTMISQKQLLPGIINTVLVTQIALVCSGAFALFLFPFISNHFHRPVSRQFSHLLLVIMRSTPELIIAFALLLLWGPSMLPAIAALALHNGAIIGHLLGRYSNHIVLRIDASAGLNRYCFEILPRLYGQFLAFLCYRWEVIMRESAIIGLLGIPTLGFYIDSAFESFRLDVAFLLIAVSASMNIGVDSIARFFRHRLQLSSTPELRTPC